MKIGLLFAGQGAQYLGMGVELAEEYSIVKSFYDRASKIVGYDTLELCKSGPEEKLNETKYTQVIVTTTSVAIYELLKEKGIKFDAYAGLSLGEYGALYASGAINFEELITLVMNRGRIMQEEVSPGVGAMCAVLGMDREAVANLVNDCKHLGVIEIANYNCPGQYVVGGEVVAVQHLENIAADRGAKKAVMLPVSGPFHTSLLKSAADKFMQVLEPLDLKELHTNLYTNVTGKKVELSSIKDTLHKQMMSSVYFEDLIVNMINDGIDTFIEVGPKKTLSSFVKQITKTMETKIATYNVEDMKSLNKTLEKLGV